MSRIAGLIGRLANTGPGEEYLPWLGRGIAPRPDLAPSVHCQPGAALLWTGAGEPEMSVSRGVAAVWDGDIYNRRELGLAGTNQAEALIELYHRHGFVEALTKINGDFAAALFDPRTGELWLARDRFGVKPLYYCRTAEGGFAFASRPRPLTLLPGVGTEVNPAFVALFAASHYRYFDNDPQASPYAGVSQLPARHVLRLFDGRVELRPYWDLEDGDRPPGDEQRLAREYRDLFFDAVDLRLRGSANPAFTLSGGMDSSSVLATAVALSGQKQHAFSTVYEDSTYDESSDIESMLATAVSQWHRVPVDQPDVFGLVREMTALHDEPVATATWLSHYLLCRQAAAQGFGGLFGGLGGDELNAGEYEYFFYFFADLQAAGREGLLSHEVRMWASHHDHPIFRKNREVMASTLARVTDARRPGICLPERGRMQRYLAALNPEYFDLAGFAPAMDHPFTSYLCNRAYQDIFRETAPCCLRALDRHGAAFGLKTWLPFFDHRLVEFTFGLPGELKIKDGVTKHLLRQAMSGVLPEATRARIKKTGWNAPAHLWFSGRGMEQVRDLVGSRAFRERGVYQVDEVGKILDDHQKTVAEGLVRENHMMFIWQLVNLELWLGGLEETRPPGRREAVRP